MDNNTNPTTQNVPVTQKPQTPTASQPTSTIPVAPKPATQPQQQNSTPQDPQTGYEKLAPQHRRAVDLKLLHYPYRIISKKLIAANFRATEATVETWFSKGGSCHAVYEAMVAIRRRELEESINEQKDMIQQGTANALVILNRSLEKAVENDEISVEDYKLAQDMLDRGGVPKQAKNENNNTNRFDSEGMIAMASAIKSVLEQPKK